MYGSVCADGMGPIKGRQHTYYTNLWVDCSTIPAVTHIVVRSVEPCGDETVYVGDHLPDMLGVNRNAFGQIIENGKTLRIYRQTPEGRTV